MLTCPEPRARAAATRVLCYWRDRVSDPLELLRKQVNDEHPRVRLEAIRALSFFDGDQVAKAQEIALESLLHPQDEYLEYTLNETNKTLDQRIKDQSRANESRSERRARIRARAMSIAIALTCSALAAVHPPRPRARKPTIPPPDSPLVKLLKSGRVPEARQGTIVDMIGKRGTAGDLAYIYQQASPRRLPGRSGSRPSKPWPRRPSTAA